MILVHKRKSVLRMVEDRGPYARVEWVRVSGYESLGYEYMGDEAHDCDLAVMRQEVIERGVCDNE